MSSKIENGLGAKIKKAQDLLVLVSQFQDYNPPRTEDQVTSFTSLVQEIVAANSAYAQFAENYRIAVDTRRKEFAEKEFSVEKLISPICNAVESVYGKTAKETILVREIARKMRSIKTKKSNVDKEITEASKSVSQSELSYGSMLKRFRDMVDTLSQYSEYTPQKQELQMESLQIKAETLLNINNDVLAKMQSLKLTQYNRSNLYEDLKQRGLRIKSYIRSNYGLKSQEYQLVKVINF